MPLSVYARGMEIGVQSKNCDWINNDIAKKQSRPYKQGNHFYTFHKIMAKKDAVTKITTPVQGTIVKSIKKYVSENSEQLNDKKHVDVVHPIVDFRLLTRAVEQSFIIGGIIDMIAKNADT